MLRTSLPRAVVALLALFASGALFAQPGPVIVIDFGARTVPLGPWSSVGAALLIAAAAYVWAVRVRAGGAGRLSAWIAIVGAATGAALMVSKADLYSAGRKPALRPS